MSNNTLSTDWQVSHTEQQGRVTVVVNMEDDPDDAGGLAIHVKGRGSEKVAAALAALLQSAGFAST